MKDGVQVTGALGNRRDTAHGGFSGGNDDMRDPATTMADQAAAGCVGFAPDPTEWSIGRRVMRGEAGHQEPGVARHRRAERMNGTGSIVIQILLADQPRIVSVLRPPTSLAGPKPSHGPCDLLRDDVGGVVLPDAQHSPTRLTQ